MKKRNNTFYAMLSRMKYIERWALMRNSERENISEHSLEVAMIAHALAIIGNVRLGRDYNAEHIAMLGIYHDCTEIITGDMPTPVKYDNEVIKEAYKRIEENAADELISMLPEDLREAYMPYLKADEDKDVMKLVKAADKLSALVKCIEEEKVGNREFVLARKTTMDDIIALNCEEADIFCKEFLGAYEKTLDEL
ncbi:MAG: 5'-deoxynucleotidase [Lachnospiraceae bacterium]|nr:5'-deoxynucleotidase [Lachnospiraceae bacterium]MCI5588228.1 5'-deoxynucleotidase [Lachnospiraceae bacterium]